jgi:hypothetical protein
MNASRTGPVVAAAAWVLLCAGCAAATPSAASPPSEPIASCTVSSATVSSSGKMASVDVAVIAVFVADTVTRVDGEIVPATADNQTINRLRGPEHMHTDPRG